MKKHDIVQFLLEKISEIAEIPVDHISVHADLSNFGIDSVVAVVMAEDLNRHFGSELVALEEMATLSSVAEIAALASSKIKLIA